MFLANLNSPTLRVPALMLSELAVNGSGAATFDNFCNEHSRSKTKSPGR